MLHPAIHELHQHAAALRRLARDLVGVTNADDVLQDAAVEVLRRGPREPGPMLAWLRSVVRHVASKRRRADAVRRQHENAAAGAGERAFVAAGAEAADTLRVLTEWVTELPEPYRSTVLARYLQELTPNEIAAATGVPVRTVKTRLQRGLQLLRERGEQRGSDWRGAFALAFGFDAKKAAATTLVAAGVLTMHATAKWAMAVAVLLTVGFAAWQLTDRATPAANPASTDAAVASRAAATPADGPAAALANDTPAVERTRADAQPQQPTAPTAKPDEIVVRVVDVASNQPVLRYGLREHIGPLDLRGGERPLLHGGDHPLGRLVLQASALEKTNFVVEAEGDYLTTRWFDLRDAVERDGERGIDVGLAAPIHVTVRVVRERSGEPVVGTKIELLRPWPTSPEVTLRTLAVPSPLLRVQPDEPAIAVAFSGGRALLLGGGVTDDAGRIVLRVPADEALALRCLGPGHRPVVRQPFAVTVNQANTEIVETVASGGAIEVRVLPIATWERLGVSRDVLAANEQWVPAFWGRGIRLRNVKSGELRPSGGGIFSKPLPLDDAGRCVIDGLDVGDWEVSVCYMLRMEKHAAEPLAGVGTVSVVTAVVRGLARDELRIVDVDVTAWANGDLDVSVVRDGQPLRTGQLTLWPVGENGAGLPACSSLGFHARDGRFTASLPPARYFAHCELESRMNAPLGEISITSGVTTRVDLPVDLVDLRVRVLETDGATPSLGEVTFMRDGWGVFCTTNAEGFATASVLRDDTVHVTFQRCLGKDAAGRPTYAQPIDLGTLRATSGGDGKPTVLRLPAR